MVCGMKPFFLLALSIAGVALFSACEKQPYSKLEAMTAHSHHDDKEHTGAKDHEAPAAPTPEEKH